jgi:formylglycine-generating enzyme required for sulfatase activity
MLTLVFATCEDILFPESDIHTHQWSAWTLTTVPTCTEPGEETRVCARDRSHIGTRTADAIGHDWSEWEGTVTCTEAGRGTRVCANNEEHTETDDNVPALGHSYEWEETTAPTCTAAGEDTGTCTRNEAHTDTRRVDALGHDWGAWMETIIPAPATPGEETRLCARDQSYTEKRTRSFMEMEQIPGGRFTMGSSASQDGANAGPQHTVTLTGFSIGRYEVTQEQYKTIMETNPSYFTDPAEGESQKRRPVERVSWYDALVFCNRLSMATGLTPAYRINGSTNLNSWGEVPTSARHENYETWNAVEIVSGSTGYRLPTEAQWEYVCRAGTATAYNTGATISDNTGWYTSNSKSMTHEVGKKPANVWNLYDMHGNVQEWCWDWYGTYSSAAQTDPAGPVSGTSRVVRGGAWNSPASSLRSVVREQQNPPFGRYSNFGFRVVRP